MEGVEEAWASVKQGRALAADVWSWLVLELVADLGEEAPGLWQISVRMAWACSETVVHEMVLGAPADARVVQEVEGLGAGATAALSPQAKRRQHLRLDCITSAEISPASPYVSQSPMHLCIRSMRWDWEGRHRAPLERDGTERRGNDGSCEIPLWALMTHKYRGSQQSSREVKPKFIDSTQGEPKNIYKP
jgi:hypothetical protein